MKHDRLLLAYKHGNAAQTCRKVSALYATCAYAYSAAQPEVFKGYSKNRGWVLMLSPPPLPCICRGAEGTQ